LRRTDRHSIAQGYVPVDRPDPLLQFLEAQAVANFAMRSHDPEGDILARQFIVQPSQHSRARNVDVGSTREVVHHAFAVGFAPRLLKHRFEHVIHVELDQRCFNSERQHAGKHFIFWMPRDVGESIGPWDPP